MGFDWELVQSLLDRFSVGSDQTVLDPFCGAGTTLVQCKKQGITSIGIDANPVCVLASLVKTNWRLDPDALTTSLKRVLDAAGAIERRGATDEDPALQYLKGSGMIGRGWISLHKARKVIALGAAIKKTVHKPPEHRFFQLALISALVNRIADIKFGPEVYCLSEPRRFAVNSSFTRHAEKMIDDLTQIAGQKRANASTRVFLGDSRRDEALRGAAPKGVDFVITSPPYPNEHDYTRNSRLELVILGYVRMAVDLQPLKQSMVRCNTKGLYKNHADDERYSARYLAVRRIARTLDRRAIKHTDRFSKLYGQMVREYFGGMVRHLRSAMRTLRPGGRCAYVVRDQQSLLGLYVDTPKILAGIATSHSQGFRLDDIIEWKKARGSTGVRTLSEKILIFRKSSR